VVKELGKYVVIHPQICHGAPTIKGTRIMVKGILEQLEDGMTWDEIVYAWDGSVTRETIAEVIRLAAKAFLEQTEPARVSV
jgi:uncharacterized protein (DUF433 family)